MKLSRRVWVLIALLVAAIGYTVFNWVTGAVDSDAAILYILVLSFPLVRMFAASLQQWKNTQE